MDRDKLEDFANWLNDMDHEWWPFLFMRPARHERMTEPRVLGLSALYGILAGVMLDVVLALLHKHVNPVGAPLLGTLFFFVTFRLTFARAWNRRADRLARKKREIFGRR